ncbi:MAG: FtsQ-type POTRA domain-containing protein [Deltaproteobacteria bacterium]|nr:FtsQ-type POTRA domain-containing protein [Deltaproteobacteria bacterium]
MKEDFKNRNIPRKLVSRKRTSPESNPPQKPAGDSRSPSPGSPPKVRMGDGRGILSRPILPPKKEGGRPPDRFGGVHGLHWPSGPPLSPEIAQKESKGAEAVSGRPEESTAPRGGLPGTEQEGKAGWTHPAGTRLAGLAVVFLTVWVAAGAMVQGVRFWHQPITSLSLSGNQILSREELLSAAGVFNGISLAETDPYSMSSRLTALPWVKTAEVRRSLPGVVRIQVEERIPALWLEVEGGGANGDGPMLVDQEGAILTIGREPAHQQVSAPSRISDLPRLKTGRVPANPGEAAPGSATVGRRLEFPALRRGLAALKAAEAAGYSLQGARVNATQPFVTRLFLPTEHQEILLAPHLEQKGVELYRLMKMGMSPLMATQRIVDLRMAFGKETRRVYLRQGD